MALAFRGNFFQIIEFVKAEAIMNYWNGAEHMGFMWLWWIIGIVLIVVIVWAVAKPVTGRDSDSAPSAEEILKRRYAKGEIDKDEYLHRLEDLRR